MTLLETCDMIMEKVNEAGRIEANINTKINAYNEDKEQAEMDKMEAMEAGDEEAFNEACKAFAEAEAGIAFNTICLKKAQRKKYASELENRKVMGNLNSNMMEIYLEAINEIEKALQTINGTAKLALEKLETIGVMSQAWNEDVMRVQSYNPSSFLGDRKVLLQQYVSLTNSRLLNIKYQKDR